MKKDCNTTADTIEQELAQFRPRPDEIFYKKLSSAPWMSDDTSTKITHSFFSVPKLGTAILAFVAICFMVIASPPLRAMAQELLGLFQRYDSDVIASQTIKELEQDRSHLSSVTFINPEGAAFAGAEEIVQFPLWSPSVLVPGYYLSGISISGYEVLSFYKNLTSKPFSPSLQSQIMLIQEPKNLTNNQEWLEHVGASAEIEIVQIGEIQGEYVEGYWAGYSSESDMEWHSFDNVRTLRWNQDGFIFMMVAYGMLHEQGSLNQKQMIVFAENIVPSSQNERLKKIMQ